VTSANRSGEPEACTAQKAVEALGCFVELALDAGPSPIGEASTVAKVGPRDIEILRDGALSAEALRAASADHLVLFVCSGNICRSPMAEYLLRRWLGADSGWRVASAGVSAFDGLRASREAIEVLQEKGIDLTPHHSRSLTREVVDAASVIVVMTAQHRSTVLTRFPEAAGKVFLLKSFGASSREEDVEDPIGASADTYRHVRDELGAVMPDLVLFLHERARKQA